MVVEVEVVVVVVVVVVVAMVVESAIPGPSAFPGAGHAQHAAHSTAATNRSDRRRSRGVNRDLAGIGSRAMLIPLGQWMQDRVWGAEEAARRRAESRLQAERWPSRLLEVLDRLRVNGHQAPLVGGTVRDALTGRRGRGAFDVATDRTPDDVSRRFARVEPIGLEHGTVLIVEDGFQVECTTFRREGEYGDSRRPDRVEYTRDLLEDLDRRDLTVNALAYDPAEGRLVDPHGGARDLERRRLRSVGDPLARFREDALRPLRAARLAAILEFEPDEALEEALAASAREESGVRLDRVSMERVRAELERMLEAPRPSVGLELLERAGLLAVWLPELSRGRGVAQNRYHAHDVFHHGLYACDAAPVDKPAVRWAALLHDIGKPDTRVERDGEGTFHQHEQVGAEMVDRVFERLRFPTAFRRRVVHLVREHMFDYRHQWSDAALRRWLRRVGPEAVADLFDLRIADAIGNGLRPLFPHYLEEMRERIERMLREATALTISDLAVNGEDVMRTWDCGPGPRVGWALRTLLEEVVDHPARNERRVLLERLRELGSRVP